MPDKQILLRTRLRQTQSREQLSRLGEGCPFAIKRLPLGHALEKLPHLNGKIELSYLIKGGILLTYSSLAPQDNEQCVQFTRAFHEFFHRLYE